MLGIVYLIAIAAEAISGALAAGRRHMDVFGVSVIALIGSDVALRMGYALPVVVMAGMITGIFGGVLRDVLCNQVPVVFRQELYAVVSLAVCLLFLLLRAWGVPQDLNTAISFAAGLALRMLAIWRSWRLPTFSHRAAWD